MAKANAVASARALSLAKAREREQLRRKHLDQGCGYTLFRKADGQYWSCTFADNFSDTSVDPTKWMITETSDASGYHSGQECMVNRPGNVSISGGSLRLTVRKEAEPFLCNSPHGAYQTQYTGGTLTTHGRFAQAYGRCEFRAKFPDTKVAGVHSSLWMFPQAQKYGAWPASGEIDVAEFYSQYPDRAIPYVHYKQDGYDPTATNNYCMIADPTAFHTYVVEWTTTKITVKYDGATCIEHVIDPAAPMAAPAPFDDPFNVVLTQALGVQSNAFDPDKTPLPATMQVDYVRAWS